MNDPDVAFEVRLVFPDGTSTFDLSAEGAVDLAAYAIATRQEPAEIIRRAIDWWLEMQNDGPPKELPSSVPDEDDRDGEDDDDPEPDELDDDDVDEELG